MADRKRIQEAEAAAALLPKKKKKDAKKGKKPTLTELHQSEYQAWDNMLQDITRKIVSLKQFQLEDLWVAVNSALTINEKRHLSAIFKVRN